MEFNSGFKGLIQHLVSSLSVSDRPVQSIFCQICVILHGDKKIVCEKSGVLFKKQ